MSSRDHLFTHPPGGPAVAPAGPPGDFAQLLAGLQSVFGRLFAAGSVPHGIVDAPPPPDDDD